MSDTVHLAWQEGLACITLNRPAVLNALNLEMAQALRDTARALATAAPLRAVLLTGAGRAFMAGGDVSTFNGDDASVRIGELITVAHEALEALIALPVPVVAAVQGAVAGGGLGIACAADLVIAADNAKFLMAYSKLGTSPDCGTTWILPRTLGLRRALGFALLEETLDAATALQMGLVNRVVPAAELESQSMAIGRRLAAGPTIAFGRTKALLRQSSGADLPTQLAAERDNFLACGRSGDFAAGIAGFQARQPPVFSGT